MCLLEVVLEATLLTAVNAKLLSLYYSILVLAVYLTAFDLHFALPLCVRTLSYLIQHFHHNHSLAGVLSTLQTQMQFKFKREFNQQEEYVADVSTLLLLNDLSHNLPDYLPENCSSVT